MSARFPSLRFAPILLFVVLLTAPLAACGGSGGGGGPGPGVAAPAGLQATAGNQQVDLAWNPVVGATSYFLYQGAASGLTTASAKSGPHPAPATTVTGLANGTIRYFAVTALVGGVESPLSAEVSATPAAPVFRLVDATPTPFAKEVSPNTTVSFTFTSAVDPATAQAPGAVRMETGSIHAPVAVPFTLAFHGTTMVLTPNAALAVSTRFRTTIANSVAGTNGVLLPGTVLHEMTTGASADLTAPAVTSVLPANGSTNVPATSTFEVAFSEDIRAETVTGANVTFTTGGNPVAASVLVSASNKILVKPNAALAPGATFTLTVGTGVSDRAGNALAAPFVSTATTAAAAAPANTTSFMLYVNSAGDALERILVNDINAWEAAGGSDASPNVRMYAQMDAANAQNAPRVPATPFHLRLGRDANRTNVGGTALRVVPAGDLTTAASVSDFLLACNADFAAQRNIFVFSNHGMNYQGTNAANGNNRIELTEIVQALTTAKNAGVNLDVIVFDVCVMGGWEDLALVAPFANYIVAGETTTTGMEWESAFTQTFFPNIAIGTRDFLKDLVDKTVASSNRGEPNGFFVYDCSKVPALKTAAVEFYAQLHAAIQGGAVTVPQFTDAFNASIPLEIFDGGDREMCDLVRLSEALSALPGAPALLKTAAQAVIAAVKDVVVFGRTSALWEKLSGVSAALGKADDAVLGPVLQAISPGMANPVGLLAGTRAAHFAKPANRPAVGTTRSLNTVAPTPAAPLELDVSCTNGESALLYGVVSKETAPGSNLFEFLGVNQWTDDAGATVEWRWDGRLLTISDGTVTDQAPGFPVDFESTLIEVDAELTDAGTGSVQDAAILVDLSGPRIEAVLVDAGGSGKGWGVVLLQPGDTLRIVKHRWDEAADDVQSSPSPLVLTVGVGGIASFTATMAPASSGAYEYGVIVEDPEGNEDETSVTVTIP